jgi:hypothetical protein
MSLLTGDYNAKGKFLPTHLAEEANVYAEREKMKQRVSVKFRIDLSEMRKLLRQRAYDAYSLP